MIELAELARWTPVRVDFSGNAPAIDWADLSAERFSEPFFDQTVARWAASSRFKPLVRTGLEALIALDSRPSPEPAGMIFHLSRCGSTLVSRLLSTLPGVVVIAEPAPLNALLGLRADRLNDTALVPIVRMMLRALSRRPHGEERQVVLKCTSWNIRRRELLAAAFPDTPWVWVQRDPVLVMASLFANPPGWLTVQGSPAQRAWLFGLDPAEIPAMTRAEFAGRALGAMLQAAAVDSARRLSIDHTDLPAAVWDRVAPHLGLELDPTAVARMTAESRWYSKSPVRTLFNGDAPERRPITDAMREAARRFAEADYHALKSPA
jgi:hypothetical protein